MIVGIVLIVAGAVLAYYTYTAISSPDPSTPPLSPSPAPDAAGQAINQYPNTSSQPVAHWYNGR